MSYPELFEDDFYKQLLNKKEFHYHNKSSFYKKRQQFIKNYINPETPYSRILLMHSTGVGKSLSAIAVAEEFKKLQNKNLYEKTIIIAKNSNISDVFIKELSGKCCEYNKNTENEKEIRKKINSRYEFITFGSLTNKVLGIKQPQGGRKMIDEPLTDLSNRVIIIDEFHNILGNESYVAVQKLLDNSKNFRLVLLSATPFTDSISELYQISNLLNEPSDKITQEEFNNFIVKTKKNLFIKNEILTLNDEGKQFFSEKLKGKISYMDITGKDFPKKNYKGKKLLGENSITIFETKMSTFQTDAYKKALEDDKVDPLYKNSSGVSTYVGSFSKNHEIQTRSCKINSILSAIKSSKGTVFVYSNYVSEKGVKLVSDILTSNNISNVALSENIEKKVRDVKIKIFNSSENKYGEKIKVLIGSPVLSEGITLKNVRQIHVLEPYWNMSKIDQVIGRAVRRNSHSDLPENERVVDIYLHCAIPADKNIESIDKQKYTLSYYKDIAIKKSELFMKQIAIDCPLNKRKEGSKDNSRECDYSDCDYKCSFNWKKPEKFDKSTFYKSISVPEELKRTVLDLFKNNILLNFNDIKKMLPLYNKQEISKALNEIIIKRIPIDENRVLIYKKGLYISTNKNIDAELVPEILFLQIFSEDEYNVKNLVDYNQREVLPFEKKSRSEEKKSPADNDFSNEKIYGTFVDKFGVRDGKFRIVLSQDNKDVKDMRNLTKGKVCVFYKKEEMAEILKKYFNKQIDGIRFKSKEELCDIIKEEMKSRNLLKK